RIPLADPVALLGRAAGCDIRLQVQEIESHHCVLACTNEGVVVRPLEKAGGTLVNGEAVASATILRHGDVLTVGAMQLMLHEPEEETTSTGPRRLHDAWRV